MRRKLIPQGRGGSLTLYLPKKWLDERGLAAGAEVEVLEEGAGLAVAPAGKMPRREKVLAITPDISLRLRTLLATAYRCGYERIVLEGERLSMATVQEIAESLPGFMVVEEGTSRIVIENLVEEHVEPPERILRRLFHRIAYFLQATMSCAPEVETLRRSIFQLRDYAQRAIFVTGYGDDHRYEWYVLIFLAEKIAGNYYDASVAKKVPQRVLEEYAGQYQQAIDALYRKDASAAIALANSLSSRRKQLYRAGAQQPLLGALHENLFSFASRVAGLLT